MATDTQQFKTVATFNERVMADMCVALLGDNGIPAAVIPGLYQARRSESQRE